MARRGARLVRAAARRSMRRLRAARSRFARRRACRRSRSRPLRAHALGPQGSQRRTGRRRRHGHHQGPRVREGRHSHLHRARRVRARVPQADPRRRGRSALLGVGRVAHRPSAEPQRAGRAHEHALRRDQQMVVRRRRRPDARARRAAHPGRPRHDRLPRRHAGGLRAARDRRLRAATSSGARSTSSCRIARKCAASAASSTIT